MFIFICVKKKYTYDKAELIEIVKISTSIKDVLLKLNRPINSFYFSQLRKVIIDFNLDTSHFEKNVELICECCKKIFIVNLHDKDKRKFCSLKCANQKVRGNALQKNINEIDEKTRYKRICFSFHKKECVVCKESNIVTVHHYDENHENNDIRNLIPLCPTHHSYMHSKYKNIITSKVDDYRKNIIDSIESNTI